MSAADDAALQALKRDDVSMGEDYMSQLAKSARHSSRFVSFKARFFKVYLVLKQLVSCRGTPKREDAFKTTVLADGRTVYRCTLCAKDFATYSDVSRHMDYHEGRTSLTQGASHLFTILLL